MHSVFFPVEQNADGCAAQPRSRFDDLLQNRRQIERRLADGLQEVRRRGLLFKRLRDLRVTGPDLPKLPHVLERNHSLSGKGL